MMIETESSRSVFQGPTYTPIVNSTWRKREEWKEAKRSFSWALINVALAFLTFLDM